MSTTREHLGPGAEGEKYVCKPDAFEATYELVGDDGQEASGG